MDFFGVGAVAEKQNVLLAPLSTDPRGGVKLQMGRGQRECYQVALPTRQSEVRVSPEHSFERDCVTAAGWVTLTFEWAQSEAALVVFQAASMFQIGAISGNGIAQIADINHVDLICI